jgi:hypothetical protein
MAFVFLHFDSVWRKSPERCWHVLDIFAENSRVKMLEGNRLLILVQVDDRRTYLKPVDATGAGANFAEFGRT